MTTDTSTSPTNKLDAIDWAAVAREYRTGIKSERVIAREFGISRDVLRARAESGNWQRDLGVRIRARTDAKLATAALSGMSTSPDAAADSDVVEVNAEMQKNLILSHRTDIQATRAVWMALLNELRTQNGSITELVECANRVADLEAGYGTGEQGGGLSPSERTRLNSVLKSFNAAISLSSRSQTVQRLSDALKTLVALERTAFAVEKTAKPVDSVVEALKALYADRQEESRSPGDNLKG